MSKKIGLLSTVLGSMLLVACGVTPSSSDSTSTPSSSATSTVSSSSSSASVSSSVTPSSSELVDEAQEFLDIAYDALGGLFADPSNIIAGFNVPSSLANGVTATWESDLPGVVAFGQPASGIVTAVVNRPSLGEGDADVTITATLSIASSISSQTLSRDWVIELTVKEETVAELEINDVADILAIRDTAYDNTLNVTVDDMTIVTVIGSDAFAYDGTGTILLYQLSTPLVVGKVYTISGIIDWYFGLWEIKNVTAVEQVAATPSEPTLETIDSVDTKIASLTGAGAHLTAFENAAAGNFEPIHATVTGLVHMIAGDTGNYNTWILDKDNTAGYVAGNGSTKTPANGLMVYYQTLDFNLLRQYAGIVVTIDVIIYTYRSNNNGFAIYYTGGSTGISAVLSDEQKQTLDGNSLSMPATILEATTLTLSTLGSNGSTIAWTSSNSAIINATTGEVVIPESAQAVTLTASVTIGSLSAFVKTFIIVVGLLENTDLVDFDTLALNTIGYSEVKVLWKSLSGSSLGKAFVVGDATGFAYVFNSTVLSLNVGDFVGLNYKVGAFRGLNQMTEVQILVPEAETAPTTLTPTTWTSTEATTFATSLKIGVRYVTFENVIGYQSSTFTNGYLPGFGIRQIQLNGADATLRNTKFNVTGWMIGRSTDTLTAPANSITIQGELYSTPEALTDAEKLALAAERYVAPVGNAEVTANLTLPTTTTPVGTTITANITWTSSNTDVISNTGVVTRPAIGSPDAEVTMSYVLTVGEASSESKNVVYTVKASVENEGALPVVVTASYPGGSTTNMAASPSNNASAISLDSTLFTVLSIKNGASSEIGLNTAGSIRLYAVRADGNGNTLSVQIASGYTITGVEFVFGVSTNSPTATLMLGSTSNSLVTADLLSVTKTYADLSIDTFTLKNTQNTGGAGSNAQIFITSIKITYQANA